MNNFKRKNILLLMEWYDHAFREGIGRFAAERRWIVTVNDNCTLPDGWRGDGILTYFDTRKDIIRYVANAGIPVVNLSGFRPDIDIPSVTGDNVGIGRMAADFFLGKGFRRAAYFSTEFRRLQKLRLHGFTSRWREATGEKIVPFVPALDKRRTRADDWTRLGAYLREKLAAVRKPLAVFAYCDYDAAKVEAAALEAGLDIPKDVAILGVDNDPLVCENDVVPLSSIDHDRVRIGYEGAALLEKLMAGEKVEERNKLILPRRLEERASTRGVFTDDPLARKVIDFFSDHLRERIGVPEAAEALGLTTRSLERYFQSVVGRPVTSFLRELRLAKARQMVEESDLPFGEIADVCGYANAQHFSNVFRRSFGITPSEARAHSPV